VGENDKTAGLAINLGIYFSYLFPVGGGGGSSKIPLQTSISQAETIIAVKRNLP
jgi:hypothetical protein